MEILAIILASLALILSVISLVFTYKTRISGRNMKKSVEKALTSTKNKDIEKVAEIAYKGYGIQFDDNIAKIISFAKEILDKDGKESFETLSQEWLNLFFEGARNISCEYMARVWAKLLAGEAKHRGTISYKTLQSLRTLSEKEFSTFLRAGEVERNGEVIIGVENLSQQDIRLLDDLGLLSLKEAKNTLEMDRGFIQFDFGDNYALKCRAMEKSDKMVYSYYPLTTTARELLIALELDKDEKSAISYANALKLQQKRTDIKVELHRYSNETYNGMRILDGANLIA